MRNHDWNALRLYLLREAAKHECSRVLLTNDCLKKILHRDRVHYPQLINLAQSMFPVFEGYKSGYDRHGVKTNLTLSVEKGKTAQGKLHIVPLDQLMIDMKRQLGLT